MRLTVYTDFSLRALMYIGVNPDRLPTIAEIADSYRISKNHLMKVVYELGRAGYIETVRGRNGGLRLARLPEEISLADVVRTTEPDMALVPCFEPIGAACAILPACKLKAVLHEAGAAFLEVLDGYTLADLISNRDQLGALLARSARPEAVASDQTRARGKPSRAPGGAGRRGVLKTEDVL
jgi:Rrf2 family nitric oxide-sensitive transcriptional repressor